MPKPSLAGRTSRPSPLPEGDFLRLNRHRTKVESLPELDMLGLKTLPDPCRNQGGCSKFIAIWNTWNLYFSLDPALQVCDRKRILHFAVHRDSNSDCCDITNSYSYSTITIKVLREKSRLTTRPLESGVFDKASQIRDEKFP